MMVSSVGKLSKENKIKENVIRKTKIRNENVFFGRFEKFLIMNAYDIALEDPSKSYHFLLKEVMKARKKNAKEKQESFESMLLALVELLEKNEHIKTAKTLLTHLKPLDENEIINTEEIKLVDSSGSLNEEQNENDFDAWLQSKENRILINFAYSICVDSERKKAKSFLRKHICSEKGGKIESKKEEILNKAMNYLKQLIKQEIGTI